MLDRTDNHSIHCPTCGQGIYSGPVSDKIIGVVRQLLPGISTAEILGESRSYNIINARHFCIWLTVKVAGRGKAEAARMFRRDHTTVFNSLKRMSRMVQEDPRWDDLANKAIRMLGGRP